MTPNPYDLNDVAELNLGRLRANPGYHEYSTSVTILFCPECRSSFSITIHGEKTIFLEGSAFCPICGADNVGKPPLKGLLKREEAE